MTDRTARSSGPEMIMEMIRGAQLTALLSAAVELGVFSKLAGGARTAPQVAAAIDAPPRSTQMVLDALAVCGLLEKTGDTYALSPVASEHLVPGKPMYLGAATELFGNPAMAAGWFRLAEAVKNDGCVLPEHAETPKHPFWEAFARGSASFAVPGAQSIARALEDWIRARPKVRALDIAAGSGIYGLTLAKSPNVDVTLLDWPNVLVETKKWADRFGADPARVHWLEGNLFEVDYRGPYDLVVLSHVYHHFDDATCQRLTKKVAAALAPGGRVVINDFFYDDSLENAAAAMFRLTMLVWTKKGTAYTEADYRRWLDAAGIDVVDVRTAAGMPSTILVGQSRS